MPVGLRQPGNRYNPSGDFQPLVKLEIFIDLNCPYSAAALPTVKLVADHYGNRLIDVVVQQLPLSYHRNAFLSTQGLYLIEKEEPYRTFEYMQGVLEQNSALSTAATVNMTETEVLSMLGDIAEKSTGIDKNLFVSGIGAYRSRTAQVWKYAIRRLFAATPSYAVNGVDLQLTDDLPTYDEWIAFLDPIIYPATATNVTL
jgi:protein-disulfide isomerase